MAHVVLISGSMNPKSLTRHLLNTVQASLEEKGHTSDVICVGETNFPLLNPANPMTDEMIDVAERIKKGDAFVIGSPEYHGGYSGALKNLLDYQDGEGFLHKPVGLVASSGGLKAGINTLNSLRLVFRTLHSYVIPEQAAISGKELNEQGEMEEAAKKQLLGVAEGLDREIKLRCNE